MSEADKQIFDAAPELEGVEKVMHNLWGVVGVDQNGETTKYWDYLEYNYDRGDWRDVVREENGHLVVLNSKGEEQIVYPERITINVSGEELTLNTTARNHMENRIPDIPGAKLEIAKELIRLSDEGNVLPKLAEDSMTLADFWIWENPFARGGDFATMFANHSTDWEVQRTDQLPAVFALFPHMMDGEVIEGAWEVFTLVKQKDNTTSGYWVTVVNSADRITYPQQILDNDKFKTGGKSMVSHLQIKDQKGCEKWLGAEMATTCSTAITDQSVVMQAVRRSVASGLVDPRLTSGELYAIAMLMRVAK